MENLSQVLCTYSAYTFLERIWNYIYLWLSILSSLITWINIDKIINRILYKVPYVIRTNTQCGTSILIL